MEIYHTSQMRQITPWKILLYDTSFSYHNSGLQKLFVPLYV